MFSTAKKPTRVAIIWRVRDFSDLMKKKTEEARGIIFVNKNGYYVLVGTVVLIALQYSIYRKIIEVQFQESQIYT